MNKAIYSGVSIVEKVLSFGVIRWRQNMDNTENHVTWIWIALQSTAL